MWRRLAQILGLLLCTLGWGLVGCTLAMDHWRVAQLGGQAGSFVVETAWYWSDLWKDCREDSTAVVNCVDFGVLWTVKPYIQAVRGLLMIGLCFGLIATVLTFFGMECTHIGGGGRRSNDRLLITASAVHLAGCGSDVAAYCLYINRVLQAFLHSEADPSKLRYEIGSPLYLGLVGSFLILLGCTIHCATVYAVKHPESRHPMVPMSRETEQKESSRKKPTYRGSRRSNYSPSVSAYKMASVVIV